jgi:hypothetical protein
MIRHFNKARDLYNAITPIRGSQDVRPLKNREHTRRIVKLNDDAYAYVLYSTRVVTCLSDGTIELHLGGWNTPTTREFINMYTPLRVHTSNGMLYVCNVYMDGEHYPSLPIDPNQTTFFRVDDMGKVHLVGKVVAYKMQVNRERSKKVRELIKPFLDYCDSMLTIMDWTVSHDEIKKNTAWQIDYDQMEEDNYYQYMLCVVMRCGEFISVGFKHTTKETLNTAVRNDAYKRLNVYDMVECDLNKSTIVKIEYIK